MTVVRVIMSDGSAVTVPLRRTENPFFTDKDWTNWKDLKEAMNARRSWAVDETTVLNTRYIVKAELLEDREGSE